MAPRNRNRRNEERRPRPAATGGNQRMTSGAAAASVQQPKPNYNPAIQDARYITDLNPVGSPEFNRWNERLGGNYDAGGWVTWNKNRGPGDSGMLASDDEMRQFARANAYRESNNLGLMQRGGQESDAAKWDAQQAAQGQAAGTSPAAKSYKDIKSIRGGLRLGANDVLSKKEAMKIARATGRDYDKVLERALESGFNIGGAAVNRSNRAYNRTGNASLDQAIAKLTGQESPLAQMRRVKAGKGQMYSGTYELDGQVNPLIQTRRGGANPLTGRTGGGAGDTAVMNEPTASDTTAPFENPNVPQEPMTPEEMADASTIGGGVLGGGAGAAGAAGFRRRQSRLRRLGINTMGTGLLGRGLQYGNVFGK